MKRRVVESPGIEPEDPEKAAALRTVHKLMAFWGLTPRDIGAAPAAPPPAPVDDVVRYRHPLSGEVWNGHGSQPEWLRRALLTEGYTVAELRVAEGESPATRGSLPADPAA
ncbi:H-NS family nucleoid-associated regulatory protein [Caldimonas brevitalea]|uniref:H-NS histone family protein n=1 Tax=Caldimonas brevitalea TaxID=413882 RepID=A0A0G3BLD2_9BURK|nr:H-NS family nucleoid-associated regulatory protein [Caldimonas brevitalea]AKJ30232.1 hypothetical protein AAW51_3541 [Caldimonas brevitalea]